MIVAKEKGMVKKAEAAEEEEVDEKEVPEKMSMA